MTNKYLEGHQRDADWVCLFFAGPNFPLEAVESLLCRDPFPNDYAPPDFMFLPVALLRWQVEQTTDGLTDIKREIMSQDEKLISKTTNGLIDIKREMMKQGEENTHDFESIRINLFKMRNKHIMLHRRWLFAQELAGNLKWCFDRIEKRNSLVGPVEYSATLRGNVQAQKSILGTLLHDLDMTPPRMEAQQTMVR